MKKQPLIRLATVQALILLAAGCFPTADTDDACLKNNWETAQEPVIYVRMTSNATSFFDNTRQQYNLTQASSISVTGDITKIYCTGKVSGSFPITAQLLPNSGAIPLANVKIGGPYQFKFENDEDHVEVHIKLRATFPDGSVFETTDLWYSYYYTSIRLNANTLEYYVLFTVSQSEPFIKVSR
ncbi:MAG: hypothetical protein WAV93_04570 [Bacteroidales bacterium]